MNSTKKPNFSFKDFYVSKYLEETILILLSESDLDASELRVKLGKVYLNHWEINSNLLEKILKELDHKGLINKTDSYSITEKGLKDFVERNNLAERKLQKQLSSETCAILSLLANALLSALEFIIGFLSGSIGLIDDAIHTGIDIFASAVTWIGVKFKKENQAALLSGILLFLIGLGIAYQSIRGIFNPVKIEIKFVALATILINIAVNSFFSFYKFYVGGRTHSISLVADAFHTKTDIWSSIAVLIGLAGSILGLDILDPIAGSVVSLFIISAGVEHIIEAKKIMKGEDPKLEKFSKFLAAHKKVLEDRGTFVSLWLLNLKEMTEEETVKSLAVGFGRHFPIQLSKQDYHEIISHLKDLEYVTDDKKVLKPTSKGLELLSDLSGQRHTYLGFKFGGKSFSPKKVHWFINGLRNI